LEIWRRRRSSLTRGALDERGASAVHADAAIKELPSLLCLFVIPEDAGVCLFFKETSRFSLSLSLSLSKEQRISYMCVQI
jgi:hypothetical protein